MTGLLKQGLWTVTRLLTVTGLLAKQAGRTCADAACLLALLDLPSQCPHVLDRLPDKLVILPGRKHRHSALCSFNAQ
jgi:hypothetical protein